MMECEIQPGKEAVPCELPCSFAIYIVALPSLYLLVCWRNWVSFWVHTDKRLTQTSILQQANYFTPWWIILQSIPIGSVPKTMGSWIPEYKFGQALLFSQSLFLCRTVGGFYNCRTRRARKGWAANVHATATIHVTAMGRQIWVHFLQKNRAITWFLIFLTRSCTRRWRAVLRKKSSRVMLATCLQYIDDSTGKWLNGDDQHHRRRRYRSKTQKPHEKQWNRFSFLWIIPFSVQMHFVFQQQCEAEKKPAKKNKNKKSWLHLCFSWLR
jgi:hypothetical protein